MPRQPYRYVEGMEYSIGYNSLQERPTLAAIVGNCISLWSNAELQLSLLLGAMLNSSSDAAVAVFLTLQNARAQREALAAAGSVTLHGELLAGLEALLALHKSLSRDRNDLAHGIYGIPHDMPDAVLWHPQTEHAHWLIGVYNAEQTCRGERHPHARLRETLFVYKERDLRDIEQNFTDFWRAAFELHGFVKGGRREGLLEILSRLPPMREILNRQQPLQS